MTKDEMEKIAAEIYNAAFIDAVVYDTGFTKISPAGIEHIPREKIVMITDEERESLITAAYDQFVAAGSEAERVTHWRDMVYHVRHRSADQVLRMETERRIGEKFAPLFGYDFAPVPT